jgi:hypothetical protein
VLGGIAEGAALIDSGVSVSANPPVGYSNPLSYSISRHVFVGLRSRRPPVQIGPGAPFIQDFDGNDPTQPEPLGAFEATGVHHPVPHLEPSRTEVP